MSYNLAQVAKQQGAVRKGAVRLNQPVAPLRVEKDLLLILRGVLTDSSEIALATAVQRAMGWLHNTAKWNLKVWEKNALSQLGVNLAGFASLMDDDPEVQKALEWLIALLRDLQLQTATRLATQKAASLAQAHTVAQAKVALAEVRKKQLRRAQLIARDQAHKIVSQINQAQQREAEVKNYIWNHSFQANPRRHHVERQGNMYQWAKPPRGGHPGTEIGCRCTAAAAINL